MENQECLKGLMKKHLVGYTTPPSTPKENRSHSAKIATKDLDVLGLFDRNKRFSTPSNFTMNHEIAIQRLVMNKLNS